MQKTTPTARIDIFDYLRGFFILIIIIDHLYRWPNLFEYVSGRGELWVSAAEGFVIISGLLVGYVRGRKNLLKPLSEVSTKLVVRGLMLYMWTVITTIILVVASWSLSFKSPIAYVPISPFDWSQLLSNAFSLTFAHPLTHFLYLYAIFLVLSPILILLLRHRLWWLGIIASGALYWYGYVTKVEWMQWQILFYVPAIIGFYLDNILSFVRRIPQFIIWLFVLVGVVTIIWSALIALPMTPGTYHPSLFGREPLAPARVGLSFIWFGTVGWLFAKGLPWIKRLFGWLILPIGTKSLTAYITHTVPLMLMVYFIPPTSSIITNTFLAVVAILVTWAIVKIPGINRIIPR
ncbi:MAG: OpgC domain-containing protein [Candidatus Saccharimonadales bacterium]